MGIWHWFLITPTVKTVPNAGHPFMMILKTPPMRTGKNQRGRQHPWMLPVMEKRLSGAFPAAPLSLAVSEDGGHTWPCIRDLEVGDGYCMTNNSKEGVNREYSYPSVKQTPDGYLHITYTYYRQRIKYVCVRESWVNP